MLIYYRGKIMFIVQKNPKSIAAEAYRSLKTNIQYSSFDKEYKTIVITSSNPCLLYTSIFEEK